MLRKMTIFGFLACLPGMAAAFDVTKNYKMTAMLFKAQDTKCLAALETELAPKFDGFTGISVSSPSYMSDAEQNLTLLTYPKVTFFSQHGDVEGAISCVFGDKGSKLSIVGMSFAGFGLAGRASFGDWEKDSPPEQRRAAASSHSFEF